MEIQTISNFQNVHEFFNEIISLIEKIFNVLPYKSDQERLDFIRWLECDGIMVCDLISSSNELEKRGYAYDLNLKVCLAFLKQNLWTYGICSYNIINFKHHTVLCCRSVAATT